MENGEAQPQLSVVVITRDEAHNLPRLLDSVQEIADEVVVFDSGSTDGTVELARRAGARVVDCPWEGWSTTKNKANDAAQGQWILSLDADEAPDPECIEAIRRHMAAGPRDAEGAWRIGVINRLTDYAGHKVRHSGWFPDRKARLWPRGTARWTGAIHERLGCSGNTVEHRLSGVVHHFSYPCRADHLGQIERFGQVWAEDQWVQGRRSSLGLAVLKTAAQWVKTAFLKRGFLDGRTGWTIARLSAWATWRKHAILRQRQAGAYPAPRSILVTRTDALGDLVLTLPVVRALRQRFPEARIDLLVRPYAEPIARAALDVDRVLIWTPEMSRNPRTKGRALFLEADCEAVVYGFPGRDVVVAGQAARIPMRMGSARRLHTLFRLTHRNWDGRRNSGGHESWHGLRLLLPLGIHADRGYRRATYLASPGGLGKVEALLAGLEGAPVLLHPGSHGSAANWAPASFGTLASALAERGIPVIFTGTEEEGRPFAEHLPVHPLVRSGFGQCNLTELLALQSEALVVVASSTGPLHTATALGTAGIGLYGPDAPEWAARWAPIGPNATALTASGRTSDGHLDIPVPEVREAVIRLVAKRKA